MTFDDKSKEVMDSVLYDVDVIISSGQPFYDWARDNDISSLSDATILFLNLKPEERKWSDWFAMLFKAKYQGIWE